MPFGGKGKGGATTTDEYESEKERKKRERDKFVQDMVEKWEETDKRLAQLPVEDWEHMRKELLEVTDRLYDIQQYPDEYRAKFIMDFKRNDFDPMMKGANQIVDDTTMRTLYEVDDERADDLLGKHKFCDDYVKRRGHDLKGVKTVKKEMAIGEAAINKLKKEGLLLSDDEILGQFDILEQALNKVFPKIDKAALKDYVIKRDMDEKFIKGANGCIKKIQAMESKEWKHFRDDVMALQEVMSRMTYSFESFEAADEYIAEMKAATKVVKKHIKAMEPEEEEEETGGKKGAKKKKKAAPAKKKGAAEKKKGTTDKKKGAAGKKDEPNKKGWLARKFGK